MSGKLFLVSVGPGGSDWIVPRAKQVLESVDCVVSYDLYLNWIRPWIDGKEIFTMPLTQERARADKALDLARSGRNVALLSSGDIGVYAMGSLAFDCLKEDDTFPIEVVPGVSAANACASLLGAPLSHDFATLSLSDLLCPWEWIEHRARCYAEADVAVALYNVQSRDRQEGVYKIFKIFLEHKKPETVCGVVRNAYRPDQEIAITTLGQLSDRKFDMLTTVLIGNRFTAQKRGHVFTPRGYLDWHESGKSSEAPGIAGNLPTGAFWVFSGTKDGNQLASTLADAGVNVVVSAATSYGGELARLANSKVVVRSGRMGAEARRRELLGTQAKAIIDATHPFASEMSQQLMELSTETGIPYFRYERPASTLIEGTIPVSSMEEAATQAMQRGKRIFLSTGSKDLASFIGAKGADTCEWFARVAPEDASMERAISAGIRRDHLCVMQGPFSREMNRAMWTEWKIDCVITKESGEVGGFHSKAEAAKDLGLPLIVVQRPKLDYPKLFTDASQLIDAIKQ